MGDRSPSHDLEPFSLGGIDEAEAAVQVGGAPILGDPILLLHGNPTSPYLSRNVAPHTSSQGRAIPVGLIGMRRSDKPDIDYRFFDHLKCLEGFVAELGLENVTLVLHD
jgi:pimeloyl-ACP methyl ester carboxylesterase